MIIALGFVQHDDNDEEQLTINKENRHDDEHDIIVEKEFVDWFEELGFVQQDEELGFVQQDEELGFVQHDEELRFVRQGDNDEEQLAITKENRNKDKHDIIVEDQFGDWFDLPVDIITNIAEILAEDDLADYVRLRAVCKSWRFATVNLAHLMQLPWLLLPFDEESDRRSLYRLFDRKVITLSLPQTRRCLILGSTGGWLVLIHNKYYISLFNPITREHVAVSSLFETIDGLSQPFFCKYKSDLLSFDPDRHLTISNKRFRDSQLFIPSLLCERDGILISITKVANDTGTVAFKKFGVASKNLSTCHDILNYNDNFYGVNGTGDIYMFDFDSSRRTLEQSIIANFLRRGRMNGKIHCRCYLMESLEELLVVFRLQNIDDNKVKFEVYKLNFLNPKTVSYVSININNLRDQSLFIGRNRASSFPATKFSGLIRANCIYCSVFAMFGLCDCGVYSSKVGSAETFECVDSDDHGYSVYPGVVWLMPSLFSSFQSPHNS